MAVQTMIKKILIIDQKMVTITLNQEIVVERAAIIEPR
tara:strand:+ start:317 stop:430 length:114 start_codon:yes stop_codon:yes gene_type:complete